MSELFVGYGSLLSARGLGAELLANVEDAELVWLSGSRRFGKPPQKGGRLAMEAISPRATFGAVRIDPQQGPPRVVGQGFGALMIRVRPEGQAGLNRREGFDPACWARLRAVYPQGVAEGLCRLARGVGNKPLAYRAALWEICGPTTWRAAHYLPHPVRLNDGRCAVVYVAPEVGETGRDSLPSCKASHPNLRPALLDRLYQVGPSGMQDWTPAKQDHYVALCLLGAAHGVSVGDTIGEDLPPDHSARALVRAWRATPAPLLEERTALRLTLPAIAGDLERYRARFAPDLETAWRWSGLERLL